MRAAKTVIESKGLPHINNEGTFQDILHLNLAMIEAQRTRVARAMSEETRTGGLDKALSVEMKRLNAMLVTYNELVNTP